MFGCTMTAQSQPEADSAASAEAQVMHMPDAHVACSHSQEVSNKGIKWQDSIEPPLPMHACATGKHTRDDSPQIQHPGLQADLLADGDLLICWQERQPSGHRI